MHTTLHLHLQKVSLWLKGIFLFGQKRYSSLNPWTGNELFDEVFSSAEYWPGSFFSFFTRGAFGLATELSPAPPSPPKPSSSNSNFTTGSTSPWELKNKNKTQAVSTLESWLFSFQCKRRQVSPSSFWSVSWLRQIWLPESEAPPCGRMERATSPPGSSSSL